MVSSRFTEAMFIMFLLLLISSASAQMFFAPSRYDIVHDHITLDDFSKSYYAYLRVYNTWYNIELKLLREVTDKWWFDIKMYQFRSNEYHPFMPMNLGMKVSEILTNNYMGLSDIFLNNNVPTKLPIPKGKYRVKNITPDVSKAPPILIVGKYKVKTTIFDGKEMAAKVTWYGSIVEKISKSG